MIALVRDGMAAGAIGLSSGIYYAPGSYAKTDEVIAMAHAAGEAGGVYESHIRDEADYNIGVVAAVDEVIRVAEEGHIPGIVAHMKALGPSSWGLSTTLIEHIQKARDRGDRGVGGSISVRCERNRHRRRADSAMGGSRRTAGAAQADRRARPRAAAGRYPPQLRTARRTREAGDLVLYAGSIARRARRWRKSPR